MKQLDLQVIQQARTWLARGEPVWLCTVISTFGSAPRGPGAMLVARCDGAFCGSLSGGCVEEDFLERVSSRSFLERNQVVRYGAGGLAPTLALPCGGVLDILVEYIEPADEADEADEQLAWVERALNGGELLIRDVYLGSSQRHCRPGAMDDPRIQQADDKVSIRVGAILRVILAGWSPVAEFCASFALALGYEVILCDPRPEAIASLALPGVDVREVLPARFIAEGGGHSATAVLALTHDPRLDDLTLLEAVRSNAFYIGAMGSRRTSDNRLERLSRIGGLGAQQLQRIHAPIGLQLGSKSPAEIAIAVMADVLRVANGRNRHEL
ncbi:XdhC family protein [Phytopseudomonas dryadis]|uniref:Xanthine dehydrogenase n=1 Tax=Phytopseudomonas dryadis TaxID=2487520 RepID=A0A4Q9R9V8_9GAMM|nr:XdhC family protein [Pseudomonas dryadis]TBU97500.1 xanthine dehydrogenase [Pseudomonas dryadis]